MSPTTEVISTRVFKSVECYGLDDDAAVRVVCIEVADGRMVIDGRVQVNAEAIMMVCRDLHSDKRVKVVYRHNGAERELYLGDRGLRGRVRGNKRLYAALHDALLGHTDHM